MINPKYHQLIDRCREWTLLGSTASLLHWDQETMMPPRGIEYRSQQLAQLARMAHEMLTNPRVGELIDACQKTTDVLGNPLSISAVNVREIRRAYERAIKLPASLVEELAATSSTAQGQWAEARKAKDFGRFQPALEKLVTLLRRKAECLGWPDSGEPWDALADEYEPGCTAREVESILTPLREQLTEFVQKLSHSTSPPEAAFQRLDLANNTLDQFVRFVASQLGFDFTRGRLDVSTHPFCGGTHCHDIRMTTRFDEPNPIEPLFSTMHETGHGIYNQGVPEEHIGTPMGDTVSLGIHESQSRLWENMVGRSRSFWVWALPKMIEYFGSKVEHLDVERAFAGVNTVKADFIRVEADEATYNLHIVVRFEIERAVMNNQLTIGDIPHAWNQKYKQYLGVDVPDDARGCLQDIHWSMGGVGYFPTYTLGNLYAAQYFEKAEADIPDLFQHFERGEFDPLRIWLNQQIHSQGMRFGAAELCENVTGKPVSAAPLMHHLTQKLEPLYRLG